MNASKLVRAALAASLLVASTAFAAGKTYQVSARRSR